MVLCFVECCISGFVQREFYAGLTVILFENPDPVFRPLRVYVYVCFRVINTFLTHKKGNEDGFSSMHGEYLPNQMTERAPSLASLIQNRETPLFWIKHNPPQKKTWEKEKMAFSHSKPIVTKNDIFRQSDWTKNLIFWRKGKLIFSLYVGYRKYKCLRIGNRTK